MIGDDKLRFTDKIKGSRAAKKQKAGRIKAMRLFTLGFISVIALGTALLMLPFSVQNGVEHPGLLASLFTATSATCVTGLAVVDTATTWSIFGQAVILCMIQLGGIGFMTFAVLIAKIVKKMLSPKDRMLVAMSYNLNSYADIGGILKSVAIGTAVAESVGAILLFIRFSKLFPIGDAIFKSIFTYGDALECLSPQLPYPFFYGATRTPLITSPQIALPDLYAADCPARFVKLRITF